MEQNINIDKVVLAQLPFVDGMPMPPQQRIEWVKNGECPSGATNLASNDGTLNRTGVQIQQNVTILNANDETQTGKINELVDGINLINENLSHIADVSIVAQVEENRLKNVTQDETLTTHNDMIKLGELVATDIIKKMGVKNPEDLSTRTIFNETFWQKKEMGAYPGFDIDGGLDAGSQGSGMKYRIISTELGVKNNAGKIADLEQKWHDSDIGELTEEVTALRSEIGPKSGAILARTVYDRMVEVENRSTTSKDDIITIKEKIDFDNEHAIKDRVSEVETLAANNSAAIGTETTGLTGDVALFRKVLGDEYTQGTVLYDVNQNNLKVTTMEHIVGATGSDGLQGQVADLNTKIGDEGKTGTVIDRVHNNELDVQALQQTTKDIKDQVGNNTSGLQGALVLISKDVYGDPTATDPFELAGIKATVQQDTVSLKTKIDDAPKDGKAYIRQNGEWKQVSTAAGTFSVNSTPNVTTENVPVTIPLTNVDTNNFTPVLIEAKQDTNSFEISDNGNMSIGFRCYVTPSKTSAGGGLYQVALNYNGAVIRSLSRSVEVGSDILFTTNQLVKLTDATDQLYFTITGLNDQSLGDVAVYAEVNLAHC